MDGSPPGNSERIRGQAKSLPGDVIRGKAWIVLCDSFPKSFCEVVLEVYLGTGSVMRLCPCLRGLNLVRKLHS